MRRSLTPVAPRLGLLLALAVSASGSSAAPATSEELTAARETRAVGLPAQGGQLPTVTAVPQSKSVELLLQLHDQPQQAISDGRGSSTLARKGAHPASAAAPAGATAIQAAETDSSPLAALKQRLLKDAAPRQTDVNARAPAQPSGLSEQTAQAGQAAAMASRGEPGQSLGSHPLVRYIRENRIAVISICLAVLAGVWITASFSLRRGR
jgi:hypothetical protein